MQTYKESKDDVEITNGKNQGGNLLFTYKLRTLSRGTERMTHGNERNK